MSDEFCLSSCGRNAGGGNSGTDIQEEYLYIIMRLR
jgi:hypothetical protein